MENIQDCRLGSSCGGGKGEILSQNQEDRFPKILFYLLHIRYLQVKGFRVHLKQVQVKIISVGNKAVIS